MGGGEYYTHTHGCSVSTGKRGGKRSRGERARVECPCVLSREGSRSPLFLFCSCTFPLLLSRKKILTLSGRGVRTYTERNGLLGRTKPSFVRRHTGTISSSFMRFLPHPRLKLAFLSSSFLASRDKVVHLQWNKKSCTMMRPDAEQFFLFLLEEALP